MRGCEMSGELKMENGKCSGGLDFGAELDSLYGLAFGLYDQLAADFLKYNLVMTAHERGAVKALRDLSYNISQRINEMNDSRKKKGGAK